MTAQKRGLGRGLNALFEDEEPDFSSALATDEDVVTTGTGTPAGNPETAAQQANGRSILGTDQLEPSRFQPRKIFDTESLEELANSIKTHGVLQPIVVRRNPDNANRYEIIAGERRWRAAQRAQLHEVPVVIRDMTDLEALEIALIENLQREDLNPVDEAMGYKRLIDDHGYTQEQLAKQLGKSRSYIANMTRLLSLPDLVLGYLERGDLTVGHARALITTENPEALAREIVQNDLTVRDIEKLAAEIAGRTPSSTATGKSGTSAGGNGTATPYTKDVDTVALEKEISAQLGMNVTIDSRNGQSGKVFIEFKSLDQLDVVIRRLAA